MEEKDSVVGHGGDLREELGRAAEGVRHLRERFVRARPNSVSDPLDRVAAEQVRHGKRTFRFPKTILIFFFPAGAPGPRRTAPRLRRLCLSYLGSPF